MKTKKERERKRERGVDKSPQYETLVTEKARVTRDSTRAWRRLCGHKFVIKLIRATKSRLF